VAIGGIKGHNLAEVVRRGAGCVAMVTEIVGATDIRTKVAELDEVFRGCSDGTQAMPDRILS
jgi:thiamine-phosphate pyrophosphorylase